MKKGFALLETVIVITFLSVSLLLLYNTFTTMISNSQKNLLYDDASNIYKTYYLKEYLNLYNLNDLLSNNIVILSCNDFTFSSCESLLKELNVNKIYITRYDLKEYKQEDYSSSFNNYINSLSNKEDFEYRFIVEFNSEDVFSYASLGIEGEEYE